MEESYKKPTAADVNHVRSQSELEKTRDWVHSQPWYTGPKKAKEFSQEGLVEYERLTGTKYKSV